MTQYILWLSDVLPTPADLHQCNAYGWIPMHHDNADIHHLHPSYAAIYTRIISDGLKLIRAGVELPVFAPSGTISRLFVAQLPNGVEIPLEQPEIKRWMENNMDHHPYLMILDGGGGEIYYVWSNQVVVKSVEMDQWQRLTNL